MARQSRTKYAILGMLNMKPRCGYDIKKDLSQASMFFWNESYGQIYPMLRKLVDSQLATLEVMERDDQPDMKVYSITELGSQELKAWLQKPADIHPVRNEMLLKLYFGAASDDASSHGHIKAFMETLREQSEAFDRQRLDYQEDDVNEKERLYLLLTLRYGELVNEALHKWCEEAGEVLSHLD